VRLKAICRTLPITFKTQHTSWSVIREFCPWDSKRVGLRRKKLEEEMFSAKNVSHHVTGRQQV